MELKAYQHLAEQLSPGARAVEIAPLTGGVSASVTALTLLRADGGTERVVLRQQQKHEWKTDLPGGMAMEYALLSALHRRGLPVPRPRLFDPSGLLVMDFVEGSKALPVAPGEVMAALLAEIHAVDPSGLPQLASRTDPLPELLSWLPGRPELADAAAALGGFAGPPRLLHGDFWPGNLLWREGEIASVLDWEDAALGDPLSDLACARVELLCAAGEAPARRFTERYLELTRADASRLPIWDLYVSTAALSSMERWGLPPELLAARREATEAFQRRALGALTLST